MLQEDILCINHLYPRNSQYFESQEVVNSPSAADLGKTDTPKSRFWIYLLMLLGCIVTVLLFYSWPLFAEGGRLPGVDASDKLEAAGTLLRLVDTGLFKWGARIFAGLCIMSSGWALKEQRFGIAVICIIGAIMFGTAPSLVKNIFSISGNDSVFGLVALPFAMKHFLKQKIFKDNRNARL